MRIDEALQLLGENRAEYILSKQGEALMKAYSQDRGTNKPKANGPDDIVKILVKMDPTKNQQYLQWIANRYSKNDFSLEDIDRVKNDLSDFIRVRNRLQNKDLNTYTLDTLYKAMEPLLATGAAASMKTRQKWVPSDEEQRMVQTGDVKVLYQDDQLRVFIPTTFKASCHFGSGTKWCTTWKDSSTHFQSYTKQGPLYIVDCPDGKFQFHFESGQFMNNLDRPADLGPLIDRYPQLERVFKDLAEKHGVLGLLKNPSHAAMVNAVTKQPDKIKQLRPSLLDKAIVHAAMDNVDGYHVEEVFGYIMKFAPQLVTPEIKLLAIKAKPGSIKKIPSKDIQHDQVLAAMAGKQPQEVVDAFRYVESNRPDLVDDRVREDVLKKDGTVIQSIGQKATKGMVAAAVSDKDTAHAIKAFEYIMTELLPADNKAVKKGKGEHRVTEREIISMVKRSRFSLKFVPEELQTKEVIDASLKADIGSFVYVIKATPEVIVQAVSEGAFLIKDNEHIRDQITTELMVHAAKLNPRGMAHELGGAYDSHEFVPKHVDLNEVLIACCHADGSALNYIQAEKQNARMIRAAVTAKTGGDEAWTSANKKIVEQDPELRKMNEDRKRAKGGA